MIKNNAVIDNPLMIQALKVVAVVIAGFMTWMGFFGLGVYGLMPLVFSNYEQVLNEYMIANNGFLFETSMRMLSPCGLRQ